MESPPFLNHKPVQSQAASSRHRRGKRRGGQQPAARQQSHRTECDAADDEVGHDELPQATITEAVDGREALAAFHAQGADVLVSNNRMPRLDGPGLIRRLRRAGATLPIISVSADLAAEKDALAAGAHWFVHKDDLSENLPGLLQRAVAMV